MFGIDLEPDTPMPLKVRLLCDVVGEEDDQVVVVPRWSVEAEDGTRQFRVRRDQLVAAAA